MENEERKINGLEEELKKLSPVKSQISRDDLFFQAGLASATKQRSTVKRLRVWQSYSAVMTLSTIITVGWIMQGSVIPQIQERSEKTLLVTQEKETQTENHESPTLEISSAGSGQNETSYSTGPLPGSYLALKKSYFASMEKGASLETSLDSFSESPLNSPNNISPGKKSPGNYRELMKKLLETSSGPQI